MKEIEFVPVMAYLSAGTGKEISEETATVYFDSLCDLPVCAFQAAAKLALLEGQYPVFPPVGVLRRFAVAVLTGRLNQLSAEEAWGLVRDAIARFGYSQQKLGLASLPEFTRRAVDSLGWQNVCNATETEIIRSQFVRTYEAIASRDQRQNLLPTELRKTLEEIRRSSDLVANQEEDTGPQHK